MDHFVSLPALQRALEDHGPSTFPKIKLDESKCVGKDSVKKLRLYLVDEAAAGKSEARPVSGATSGDENKHTSAFR